MQTFGLSARESTVAALIKEGKTTKQISELLCISDRAVEFHRSNIRKKLGLKDNKIDLSAHLLSID
jgi:DNA-binding CsgD family transcriptional regulator